MELKNLLLTNSVSQNLIDVHGTKRFHLNLKLHWFKMRYLSLLLCELLNFMRCIYLIQLVAVMGMCALLSRMQIKYIGCILIDCACWLMSNESERQLRCLRGGRTVLNLFWLMTVLTALILHIEIQNHMRLYVYRTRTSNITSTTK